MDEKANGSIFGRVAATVIAVAALFLMVGMITMLTDAVRTLINALALARYGPFVDLVPTRVFERPWFIASALAAASLVFVLGVANLVRRIKPSAKFIRCVAIAGFFAYACGIAGFYYVRLRTHAVIASAAHRESAHKSLDLPTLIARAKRAVLSLEIRDSSGRLTERATGFFISPDGKIVTNHHVIENAALVSAKAENGAAYEVVGAIVDDAKRDIAILKAAASGVPFLRFGSARNARVGDHVAVIGNPFGLAGTVSDGVISAKRESDNHSQWLQITAPISPGSSGSPVLDNSGSVLGIATLLLRGGQSLNFAVPAEQAMAALSAAHSVQRLGEGSDIRQDPETARFTELIDRDASECIKIARHLVSKYPNNAISFYLLGSALAAMEFRDEALDAFQHSIRIDSQFGAAWIGSANVLHDMGDKAGAIRAVKRALSIDPDSADAWFSYGKLISSTVDKSQSKETDINQEKAIDAFERVITLESKSATQAGVGLRRQDSFTRAAWLNLAELYAQEGDSLSTPTSCNFVGAVPFYLEAIDAQKHGIAEAAKEDARINIGTGGSAVIPAHLAGSILWHRLFLYYWQAFVNDESGANEQRIRADAVKQLKTVKANDAQLAEELQEELRRLNHAEGERFRKTRRDIVKLNRMHDRLQQEGLLPPTGKPKE